MTPAKTIQAVRKVLYEPKRLKRIATELESIDVLMNLDAGRPLDPGDSRIEAGAGPNWLVPASGGIAPSVLEAASRCERIAALLLETRAELAKLAFPAADKRHLLTALREEAAAWKARAAAWRAPERPSDSSATAQIETHSRASVAAYRKVGKYLKRVDPEKLR